MDDEESQREGLARMVAAWGYAVETAGDGAEALEKLSRASARAIVTDMMMPRMDGAELLRRLKAQGSGPPPTIVLTAFGNIETAVETIHELGAFWFLEKPIQAPVLRYLLERAVSQGRLSEETERLQRQLSYQGVLGQMVGNTRSMRQVFHLVQQVAPSRAAVFLTGESGTGKELVARAIHNLSPRRNGPFVAVNCAALPESLMESELFGHEKGAFTGALERRAGCFELAQDGTLLLDEIGDMPGPTQAKLLRVLEDSKVRRLGGKKEMDVDVRVIAATNKVPEEAVQRGHLREDLYYRLNVFHIALPPLRERMEDIPVLVEALVNDLNRKHNTQVSDVAPEVLKEFAQHHWPGNVRELRNVLERAVILVGDGTLGLHHLPRNFGAPLSPPRSPEPADPNTLLIPVGTTVEEAEKALVLKTLEHARNNKTRAAEILGISLKTMHNKLKLYGASPGEE